MNGPLYVFAFVPLQYLCELMLTGCEKVDKYMPRWFSVLTCHDLYDKPESLLNLKFERTWISTSAV